MRAFIVCAVLALLTASAQANNNKNWGNNKPRYEATGTGEHAKVLLEVHCRPAPSFWLAAHRYRADPLKR